MSKNLVIVESPAKAKTIGRYLGKEYKIAASVGHIRDLPSSTMGVDVRHDFRPTYINMRGKEKVIRELKELAGSADRVYIATDPDREGEAIAWHIAKVLNIDLNEDCRISFNEITEKAIKTAIMSPRKIDIDLVNAQQARRMLDRLVGYELSPLLWSKVRKGLSAGRVQSVATKLVVDREKEIEAFIPEEYWNINAELTPAERNFPFKARYHGEKKNGKIEKVKVSSKEETDALLASIAGGDYSVDSIKKGRKLRQPFAPFTTSTLQQEASRRISFTSRKTMSVAQQLYEGVEISGQGQVALVSYIRTDSVRVSDEAMVAARKLISEKYGEKFLPKSPRKYSNKNSSQDAHEAIRPAHFELDPESIRSSLSADQYKLYKLIWDRFLSSQMASAEVDTVSLDVICKSSIFRAQGETIKFQGFLAAYADIAEDTADDDKNVKAKLPELVDGQALKLLDIKSEQKFTLPPARFTEATLIRTLEEKGIGRPSTYAPTISTILERNYIEKKGKIIYPTELGKVVTLLLSDNFTEIVDVSFTADMESKLDEIEVGKKDWVKVLSEFYPPFHELILKAGSAVSKVKMEEKQTGEKCPECGGDLVIKEGRFGQFVACSHFPECKFTRNVENTVKGSCPVCGSGLVSHRSNKYKGRVFYTCDKKGSDPECGFISGYLPVEGQKCDTCGSYMVWKRFRGRAYPKCANPECPKNTAKKSSKAEEGEEGAVKEKKTTRRKSTKAKEE
ncbi:MAG: type I DNA topoisomerase [Clostridiales bacterium]|nr:type I DNA topoisomerase [Clostridiales bacterium]